MTTRQWAAWICSGVVTVGGMIGGLQPIEPAYAVAGSLQQEAQSGTFDAAMAQGRDALGRGEAAEALAAFRRAVELQPQSVPALTLLGTSWLGVGDVEAALEVLDAAVEAGPADLGARRARVQALLGAERPLDAVDDARELVRLAPGEYGGRALLARIQLILGQYEEVLEILADAEALRPGDPGALYGRSVALVELGRGEEALPLLSRLVNDVSDSFAGWALFARVLRQRSDTESLVTAAESYSRALELRPADPATTYALASLYGELGLYARGAATIDAAGEAVAADPVVQLLRGRLLAQAESFAAAVPAFVRALELGAGAETWTHLGLAHAALADSEHAIAAFMRAVESDPQDAEAQLGLGEQLLAAGRTDEAIGSLTQAALLLPNSSRAQHLMGKALEASGDTPGAAATLRFAADLDSSNVVVLKDLVTVLDYLDDVAGADEARAEIAAAERAAANRAPGSPGNVGQLLRDGYVQLRLGDVARAVELLRDVVALEPENEGGRFFLGRALADLGELEPAIASLEAAQQLNSFRPETYAALADLYEQVGRSADARRARAEAARLRR